MPPAMEALESDVGLDSSRRVDCNSPLPIFLVSSSPKKWAIGNEGSPKKWATPTY